MLPDERWRWVRGVVEAALELPPNERAGHLEQVCGADGSVRLEAERLLSACERAGAAPGFLDDPAVLFVAPLLARSGGAAHTHLTAFAGGRYAVERELGRGGMATVYLALDRQHGRRVAVKVIRAELSAFVSAERFLQEIRVTAGLNHPHILPLFDSGRLAVESDSLDLGVRDSASGATTDGDPYTLLYYVMPLVEGESLRERMRREPQLPVAVVTRLGRQLASALDYAHRHDVVHRDIKPENILLQDGNVVVADFGIARAVNRAQEVAADGLAADTSPHTWPGVPLGTPAYMAPEQVRADPGIDHRADLYALGIVLYEALAGEHPFAGRSREALLTAHLEVTPAPLGERRSDVPAELSTLIAALLAKRPADRPESAAAALRVLEGNTPAIIASPWRPWARGLLAAGLVLAGALAGARVWRGTSAPSLEAHASGPVAPARSVAVLPFVNIAGDPADEHFSVGLTDELIGALGRLADLRVAGRTSVFALQGRGLSLRTIADTLGVATVVEGTMRRTGSRLRVGAQLVSASSGSILWTETYDRELRDIAAVQEEIARAIAAALSLKPGVGTLGARSIADPAAHELYLKGRYVWSTGPTSQGLRQAITFFEQAIARDSTYALPWTGLSDAHARMAIIGYGRPNEEFPRAKVAALHALALDTALAEAYASLGHVLLVYDFQWADAERALLRAIALSPGNILARMVYAVDLGSRQRFDEAIAQLEAARTLDPLSPTVSNLLGRMYVNARRPDEAIRRLEEALQLAPRLELAHQQLGHAYLLKGMPTEALASFRRAAELSGPRDSAHLAYGYAVVGRKVEARRVLSALLASQGSRYLPPFHIAIAYAGLGDVDAAFRWLDQSYEQRDPMTGGLAMTDAFVPLHGDPRWVRLLARVGLGR